MAGTNKTDDGYDYHHRLAALLSELADVLVELNNLLRDTTNTKTSLRPNNTFGQEYRAGWGDGWDSCAAEVMKIVGQANDRIQAIERAERRNPR